MVDEQQDQQGARDEHQQDQHQNDTSHDDDITLGDPGKAALKAERDARRSAEKSARDAQDKLDAIDAKQRKADEERSKRQGEWEELATKREADLANTTTELTNATTELDSLRGYVTADLETVATAVKAAAKDDPTAKVLMEFHPGEEASTAELIAWTKRAKAQLPELATGKKPGNGPNPTPATGAFDKEAAIQKARAGGRYRI